MTDMITELELKDAVAVYGKVSQRVRAVATKVGNIRGDFELEREDQPTWHMDCFAISNARVVPGMEHLLELGVRTTWSTYVEDDESRHRVIRTVQFPVWYLTKDGWEEREARKARNHKRATARLNLAHTRDAITTSTLRHGQLVRQLAEFIALAREPDEAVDP